MGAKRCFAVFIETMAIGIDRQQKGYGKRILTENVFHPVFKRGGIRPFPDWIDLGSRNPMVVPENFDDAPHGVFPLLDSLTMPYIGDNFNI